MISFNIITFILIIDLFLYIEGMTKLSYCDDVGDIKLYEIHGRKAVDLELSLEPSWAKIMKESRDITKSSMQENKDTNSDLQQVNRAKKRSVKLFGQIYDCSPQMSTTTTYSPDTSYDMTVMTCPKRSKLGCFLVRMVVFFSNNPKFLLLQNYRYVREYDSDSDSNFLTSDSGWNKCEEACWNPVGR